MFDSSIENNIVENPRKQWADDALDFMGVEPEVYQVMGGYALSKCAGSNFESGDCDVFVRAGSVEQFRERVFDKVGKLFVYFMIESRKSGKEPNFWLEDDRHGGWLVDLKVYIKPPMYTPPNTRPPRFNFQFIYVSDNYSHVQISNFFDISCCKFRVFHRKTQGKRELVTVSNNTYIKELTSKRKIDIRYAGRNGNRIVKYVDRGFYQANRIIQEGYSTPTEKNVISPHPESGYEYLKVVRPYRVNWYVLRACVKFTIISKKVRERIYAPGGTGFETAKKDFEVRSIKRQKVN